VVFSFLSLEKLKYSPINKIFMAEREVKYQVITNGGSKYFLIHLQKRKYLRWTTEGWFIIKGGKKQVLCVDPEDDSKSILIADQIRSSSQIKDSQIFYADKKSHVNSFGRIFKKMDGKIPFLILRQFPKTSDVRKIKKVS